MIAKPIVDNVYAISLGIANVFLVTARELTLIDTGVPGSTKKILLAMQELGYQPHDLRHILITHLHYDHTGSLGELKAASAARVYMHALDAETFARGKTMRPVEPSPGWLNRIIVNKITNSPQTAAEANSLVDQTLYGGEILETTGGIQALHTPGHTAGHVAYYWPHSGGVLLAGDSASNLFHLGYSFLYENFAQGQETLANLSQGDFQTACFSHGKVIRSHANAQFGSRFAKPARL